MKAKTLQILWHGRDPILSLDFLNNGLLATAGSDKDVKLWEIRTDKVGTPVATYHSSLSHHSSAVNVVRFAPTGDLVASGADGGEIIIWKQSQTGSTSITWKVLKTLGFPKQDVLALEWSPDGAFLLSGSIDHKISIWDVARGSVEQTLEEHHHYVQGVAWDPLGQYCITQSADKTCRVYSLLPTSHSKGKAKQAGVYLNFQHELAKAELVGEQPRAPTEGTASKPLQNKYHLFQDENLPSFFRRLAWSPDGSFVVIPAGVYKRNLESPPIHTTYIYSRKNLSRPAMHLPTIGKPSVAVRFCPIIFSPSLSSEANGAHGQQEKLSVFNLDYRLVFAVATLNSVLIYDTQHSQPIAMLGGLHYAAITDLAWSADGRFLTVSSQDGYCTVAVFEEGELGTRLPMEELPSHIAEHLPEVVRAKAAKAAEEAMAKDPTNARAAPEALATTTPTQSIPPAAVATPSTGEASEGPRQAHGSQIGPEASQPSDRLLDGNPDDLAGRQERDASGAVLCTPLGHSFEQMGEVENQGAPGTERQSQEETESPQTPQAEAGSLREGPGEARTVSSMQGESSRADDVKRSRTVDDASLYVRPLKFPKRIIPTPFPSAAV